MAASITPKQHLHFFVLLIGLFCLLTGYGQRSAVIQNQKDSVLTIPFGHSNQLIYHLQSGSYDVAFKSGIRLHHAMAVAGQIDTAGIVRTTAHSDQLSYTHFSSRSIDSSLGKGMQYKIYRSSKNPGSLAMVQIFTTLKDKDYFLTSVDVSGSIQAVNYSSPLSAADVIVPWKNENYALWSPFDNDMWARFDGQLLDTVNFISSELSAIYNQDRQGMVMGSLEHQIWKSGIHIRAQQPDHFTMTVFGGYTNPKVTHDKVAHGFVSDAEGRSRSPQFMVGYFDDWRIGLEVYGRNNRLAEPPVVQSWKGSTPIGWNSWGVIQDKINLAKAKGVVDFFADSCSLYRMKDHRLFIDLDSYWDNMVKGGLDGNSDDLKAFVAYCKQNGLEPGIYWGPFTDWGKQGDRKVEGSDYRFKSAWTSINGNYLDVDGGRAMDPTHPATRLRIKKYIDFFKACGFKMIKIDFLGHATLEADHFYDPKVKTGMQAFRSGMEYLDSLIGNSMLIYAAISPNLATGRYVNVRRIACDAFKSINETEYTLNSTTYGWWQSRLYDYMDADHVVFSDATPGEHRARLASAVVTGSLITGDDYSEAGNWRSTAMKLLQNRKLLALVSIDGKSFRPYTGMVGNKASHVFEKKVGQKLYLTVFNYDEKSTVFRLPYDKLGVIRPEKVEMIMGTPESPVSTEKNDLIIHLPAKDAAILCLEISER